MSIVFYPVYNFLIKCFKTKNTDPTVSKSNLGSVSSNFYVSQDQLQQHPILKAQKVKVATSDKTVLKENFGKYGTATAERVETIESNLDIQSRKLDYYEDLLQKKLPQKFKAAIIAQYNKDPSSLSDAIKNLPLSPKEKSDLMPIAENIAYARNMLKVLEHQRDKKVTWLPSPFIRSKIQKNKAAAIPSCPVNLRIQRFSSPQSKTPSFAFARHGVFFDPRDSGNTVRELETYMQQGVNSSALAAEIKKRELFIAKLQKNPKKNAAKIKGVEDSLTPLKMIQSGNNEGVQKLIDEKKRFLDDHMLQLITAQVGSREDLLPHVRHNSPFVMTHVGLLNEKKAGVHKSGLVIDEGRFITEMGDAFKRFEGKKVIFDGKGPLIDENGNIHSEKKMLLGNNQPKQVVLKPVLVNFTVQRSTTNGPLQAKFNKDGINYLHQELIKLKKQKHADLQTLAATKSQQKKADELEKEIKKLNDLTDQLVSIKTKLAKNQSNYNIACDFVPILIEFSRLYPDASTLGVFCFSGKDRTGIVAAVANHRAGVKPAVQKLEPDPSKQKKLFKKFAASILYNPDSLGAQILFENTGTTIYKVSSLFIPEVADTVAKLFRRIWEYPKTLTLDL